MRCAFQSIAGNEYLITPDEHNGKNTLKNLEFLNIHKGLNKGLNFSIFNKKQELTEVYLANMIVVDESKIRMLQKLKDKNYKICCASNCIRTRKLDIFDFFVQNC